MLDEIPGIGEHLPYEYSRTRNPSRDMLAEAVTKLEEGLGACVVSSGMAALTLIVHLLDPEDLWQYLSPNETENDLKRILHKTIS